MFCNTEKRKPGADGESICQDVVYPMISSTCALWSNPINDVAS
jgi:hypothetical protein